MISYFHCKRKPSSLIYFSCHGEDSSSVGRVVESSGTRNISRPQSVAKPNRKCTQGFVSRTDRFVAASKDFSVSPFIAIRRIPPCMICRSRCCMHSISLYGFRVCEVRTPETVAWPSSHTTVARESVNSCYKLGHPLCVVVS